MRDFKIGDRVRVIDCFSGRNLKGKTGTVVAVGFDCRPWEIGVDFDKPIGDFGHRCNGMAKADCGRWGYKSELELVENKKIVITTNGKETLARLYEGNKVIKTATAKCSPDDTFCFEIGARTAFDRLIESPLEKALRSLSKAAADFVKNTEKPKIKVGKRYRWAGNCVYKGGVLEVTKEDKETFLFKIISGMEDWKNGDRFWKTSPLAEELVPFKYEVGDKVKVIKNTCCHYAKIGDIVTLKEVRGEDKEGVMCRVNEVSGYILERDFELYTEPEKTTFIPHLVDGETYCGNIGEPTNYKDAIGRPLCIGDVVEYFNESNESYGDTVIVKKKLSYKGNREKTFVMGIESDCDEIKGTTGSWKIIKKRSFDEVKNGEKIYSIKYVREI